MLWLTNLIRSGQTTSDENGRKDDLGTRITTQFKEVFGQTRLLNWSIPGLAHFFTMWGFFILASVYLEAYGLLFVHDFHIPLVGRWDALGFLQDFFAVAVLLGIVTFAIIRLRSRAQGARPRLAVLRLAHRRRLADPLHDLQRHLDLRARPRRRGEHRQPALRLRRVLLAAAWVRCCTRWATPPTSGSRPSRCSLHIGVMLVFLLIVLHSKHLHIGLAPINVTFKRLPNGLGPLLPMEYKGEPIDFEDPAEDAVLGRGKIEDFTWKGYLDFTTCTECGRCQSQCPAWNTGKPLSPKLVIMNLRDHLFAKAPYILGDKETPLENTPEGGLGEDAAAARSTTRSTTCPSPASSASRGSGPGRPPARSSAPPSRAASSTPTCCGRAPPAAPASSSARWTSSTSTTSSTCAATR